MCNFKNIHLLQMVIVLFISFSCSLAFADENISATEENPSTTASGEMITNPAIYSIYPMGCIPEVALPVYPESRNCVANYALEPPDFTNSGLTTAETTTTSETTITQTTTSKQASTAPTTNYYYPQQPYYVTPNSAQNTYPYGAFAMGLMGGLLGAAIYNNNNNNDNDNTNTYYWNKWTGDNGSAAYGYGNNGGAYYWHYNDYSGGGYCYQGNCQHNNNWNGSTNNNTSNSTNTLNSTNTKDINKPASTQKVRSQNNTHPSTKKYTPSTHTTKHNRRDSREWR
jgi:hypothetical protein